MLRVDLNCDMGEGAGSDAAVMPYITSANIACGGHAGDAALMRETLLLAARHGVAAGAHPGFPDPASFGREQMNLTPGEIHDMVAGQIEALLNVARSVGVPVAHVKPHGALYNEAAANAHTARAIVRAVYNTDASLLLYGLARSALITEAERVGLRAIGEAFADRGYERDGTLTPRGTPGVLIDDAAVAASRVLRMVTQRLVTCSDGSDISVDAATICIHGDGAHAEEIAREVHRVLTAASVRVAAPGEA